MKAVIVGAGRIGSLFAAKLMSGGHDVSVVARGERLRELQAHGLRLRQRWSRRTETFRPKLFDELTPNIEADVILVMVQGQQVEALLPALERHPSPRVCFLFNCTRIDPAWQTTLGPRLVWGFPAALGGLREGVVEYVLVPSWLRFLQITTVGVTEGGDVQVARDIARLLDQCAIPTVYHPDMKSWLLSHAALMLPPMAMGEAKFRARSSQSLTLAEAWRVARAQTDTFAMLRRAGARVTPANMWLLARTPAAAIAAVLWGLSRSTVFRRSMLDHVDHAGDEMLAMYSGILASVSAHEPGLASLENVCTRQADQARRQLAISSADALPSQMSGAASAPLGGDAA